MAQRTGRLRVGSRDSKVVPFQYGPRCPLSGVTVLEMLEAAHLVPDAVGGVADPRNGLPMNAALHRAFDAGLFAIHPLTFEVVTRPGLSRADLGIQAATIADLPNKPHPDVLAWRYDWWASQPKNASQPA